MKHFLSLVFVFVCILVIKTSVYDVKAPPFQFAKSAPLQQGPIKDGLVLWLDTSQLTGLADNDSITNATDWSGSGNHATNGTVSACPVYKTGVINGHPVMRFDAVDDWLAVGRSVLAAGSPAVTVFICHTLNVSNINNVLITIGGTEARGSKSGYMIYEGTVAGQPYTRSMYGSNINNDRFTDSNVLTVGSPCVTVYQWTGAAISANNPLFFLNGNPVTSTQGVGADTPTLYEDNTWIGAQYGTVNFSNVDIAEVLIYNRALSAAERQYEENRERAKYALP